MDGSHQGFSKPGFFIRTLSPIGFFFVQKRTVCCITSIIISTHERATTFPVSFLSLKKSRVMENNSMYHRFPPQHDLHGNNNTFHC